MQLKEQRLYILLRHLTAWSESQEMLQHVDQGKNKQERFC